MLVLTHFRLQNFASFGSERLHGCDNNIKTFFMLHSEQAIETQIGTENTRAGDLKIL